MRDQPKQINRPGFKRWHAAGPRRARVAGITAALLASLAQSSAAELINVGPGGSCTVADLASAIERADITPEADTISITTDFVHAGPNALRLVNEAGVLFRGATSCDNLVTARRTITTTQGDLFDFSGTNLSVDNLRLASGPAGGRLIQAFGAMSVRLDDAELDGGKADIGGNIRLRNGATMAAGAGTQIHSGNASNLGGGVSCAGGGRVTLEAGVQVDSNSALLGGGIYALGCQVEVFAGGPIPGSAETYGVVSNDAISGGGIYAEAGASIEITGRGGTPATLAGNSATAGLGGGLLITGAGTTATLIDTEVIDNTSWLSGGGLAVNSGAHLEMDRGMGTCFLGTDCSLIANNQAGEPAGDDAFGGAIFVNFGSTAEVRQTTLVENGAENGGNVAFVDGNGSELLLEGCTLFDNRADGTQILVENGALATLAFVSARGSSEPGQAMAFLEARNTGSRAWLFSSLVIEGRGDDPGGSGSDPVFAPPTGLAFLRADCVLAHETASFPIDARAVATATDASAIWNDPTMTDPRLLASSPAIDFCDTFIYSPTDHDILDRPRGFDAPPANGLGLFDLGAQEWRPDIFVDGFESGTLGAWSMTVP